ncbi:hypothetical protein AO462_03525 [Oenococcus oeni]|uniref:hypothetical protein n=1 Tax=Oenococcus oeni TaxID=1247 RepID=UPI000BDE6D40|nr:hypothetical protein [Oenococcus oeni]PDH85298.1 hypothetical protein AO462_03525 [Oenococcus oeni]
MAITMYQADRNFVSPANDASLYSALAGDSNGIINRGNKFNITNDGLVATINTGQAIIQGRLVEITEAEQLTLPANSSGKICIVVDLTKTNDASGSAGDTSYAVTVNQVYLAAVTGTLTQYDLNNGGFIYELPIASFTTTATTVTVTQIASAFNDTGWINATIPSGSNKNQSNAYAQYRVINDLVYFRFRSIYCVDSYGGNQVMQLPSIYMPSVPYDQHFTGSNIDDNTGQSSPCDFVFQSKSGGTTVYGDWNQNLFNKLTGATASGSYPLN